jgi:hypothetical protein
MVVRIANFYATPQMGDFSFKHYLISVQQASKAA